MEYMCTDSVATVCSSALALRAFRLRGMGYGMDKLCGANVNRAFSHDHFMYTYACICV